MSISYTPAELYGMLSDHSNCLDKIKYDSKKETYLVFGKESTGIDKTILKNNLSKTIRIPTTKQVRALNLSNCVAMLAYEYVKQDKFNGLAEEEPFKQHELD